MTAIAGIIDKKNKKTYLASDQMGANGFIGENYKTPKLFKKDPISIAFCGSYRLGQILRHNFKPRKFQEGESVDHYVFDYLDTEIRRVLKDRKFLKEEHGVESIGRAEVLFAVKDRLFCLQTDLAILEAENIYAASGSGIFHQQASIHTQLKMDKNKDYRDILRDAISYTSEIVLSVGGKPQIIEHDH
jgi:ATP-dependent protease HslVU (ClpYQ) peptidase subunit